MCGSGTWWDRCWVLLFLVFYYWSDNYRYCQQANMYLLTLSPALKPIPWPLPVVPPLPPAKISAQMLFLSSLLAKSWRAAHGNSGCSLLRGSPGKQLAEGQEKSVRSPSRNLCYQWDVATKPDGSWHPKDIHGSWGDPTPGSMPSPLYPCKAASTGICSLSFLSKISSERKYLPKHSFESGYVIPPS